MHSSYLWQDINTAFLNSSLKFSIHRRDASSRARAGTVMTHHGEFDTPVFMPVGTAGTVKGVHQRELADDVGSHIILGNTYHLHLRPGTEILQKAGGLHKFIGWERSILTDSGGYQVYSLSENRKISEEGVEFRSHIDGSKHFFTPEKAMEIQYRIGADIVMAFDECTPYPCEHSVAKSSMELTHRWLERCILYHRSAEPIYGYHQTLFPIVQGGVFPDLRRISAQVISESGCEGNAIGGLSVGEPAEEMYETTSIVTEILPNDKPRYLMGVGTPANILECIALGVDMFDCVMPARNGRNGMLFTLDGIINIKNEKWKDDFSPVDERSYCFADTAYSRSYLRHLIVSGERLGAQIATLHNLSFYMWLVNEARRRIIEGDFLAWKNSIVNDLARRI